MHSVLVLVGSLRRGSINRQLAHALQGLSAGRLDFAFADIGGLPHYNDDLWVDPPVEVLDFKRAIVAADAVLIVTPEYNRGVPGIVKNALDWGSRPYGKNVWTGKPAAICGISLGAIGTAAAQAHLRAMVPAVGLNLMSKPEVYVSFREGLFDFGGNITIEHIRDILNQYLTAFIAWIDRLS